MIHLTQEQADFTYEIARHLTQNDFRKFLELFCDRTKHEERPVLTYREDDIDDVPDMERVDDRINQLLYDYGETIADLPRATHVSYAYDVEHRERARNAALNWGGAEMFTDDRLTDYICHLADVINRMETALVNGCREEPHYDWDGSGTF